MFAENIRRLRKNRGLTQKEAAEIFGVSQSTYALYEAGKREPPFDTLIKMADFYGVTCDMLLSHSTVNAKGFTYAQVITLLETILETDLFDLDDDGRIIVTFDPTIEAYLQQKAGLKRAIEVAQLDNADEIIEAFMEKKLRELDRPIDRSLPF